MFLLSWWRASAPANRGHKRTPPIMLTTGPEKPKPEHERERPDGRTPIVALVFEFLRFVVSRACYAQILCRYSTIFSFRFSASKSANRARRTMPLLHGTFAPSSNPLSTAIRHPAISLANDISVLVFALDISLNQLAVTPLEVNRITTTGPQASNLTVRPDRW